MSCVDMHNNLIEPGLHFVPGPDTCTLCLCENGNPKFCKAVLCSPPQNCKSFRVGHSCCDFICLDDKILGKSDSDHEFNAEFGLRLIATAITAILSLSLLFFLFHRLRQRKIRGRQDRELAVERNLGSIGYIASSLGYLPEHHFEETGAGYPLWKPTFYSRGEAPPPYEEALAAARAEAALARVPGPSIALQIQSQHRTIPVNLATSGSISGSTSPLPAETIIIPSEYQPQSNEDLIEEVGTESGAINSLSIEENQTKSNINLTNLDSTVKSQTSTIVVDSKREGPVADESDDYRSECENCNMRQTPGYEEDLVTMTLHRRTGEQFDQLLYSRASLTLPTHPRKQQRCNNGIQNGVTISCARENWFCSMPESSTSEEDEEEE